MNTIRFEFTVDEANQILQSLGDQPYIKVSDLINKIRSQAMAQINAADAPVPANNTPIGGEGIAAAVTQG